MKNIFRKLLKRGERKFAADDGAEFCPRCDANLTLHKGYCNELPYWNCKGCGEMLINPRVDTETNIAWICDSCEAMLNEQPGFTEDCDEWKCTECGFVNKIDESEVYLSEEEHLAAIRNPYNGMSDEDVITLMSYEEVSCIGDREDIYIVKDEDGNLFVKKILITFDESIYQYLIEHPIVNMPRIISKHRGSKYLVIIEEFVDGVILSDFLDRNTFHEEKAVQIARDLCMILKELHNQEKPIIHRDVKPSNIIIDCDNKVFLLDVNVAKWYKPEETEDTRLLGTLYYAAPEQFGYGFAASTEKTDIYAVGILLNMMITGKLPKEKRASGMIWSVIEKCTSLNPEDRYTDNELLEILNGYLGEQDERKGNK